jgi:hypothetical protein
MRRLRDGTEPRLFKKAERTGKSERKRKKGKRGRGQ